MTRNAAHTHATRTVARLSQDLQALRNYAAAGYSLEQLLADAEDVLVKERLHMMAVFIADKLNNDDLSDAEVVAIVDERLDNVINRTRCTAKFESIQFLREIRAGLTK